MEEGSASGVDGEHRGRGGSSKVAAAPLCLLDLDDDVLGLIAARCWEDGHAASLIAACRRTRRVALAALTCLRLTWCDRCDRLQQGDVEAGDSVVASSGPHSPSLATRLPSLRSFLSRATGVHEVCLSDGCARRGQSEPCKQPRASRERVWKAVGVALRSTPLVSVSVHGLAALAALTDPDGPPCEGLRSLRLEHLAGRDSDHVKLGALLVRAASSLACLVFGLAGCSMDTLVRSIAVARRLPTLHELSLEMESDVWQLQPLGPAEADTIATVCPRLTTLRLRMTFGRGFGRVWAATRGRLENLRALHIHAMGESPAIMSVELAHLLAGRRLDELELTADFSQSEDVVGAILGCDRLPATLRIDPLSLSSFNYLRLCQDYRAAEDLVSLSLPEMLHPESFLPGMGSLARMESLQLAFDVSDFNVELLGSGIWDVPPRLRRLSVDLYSRIPAAGPGPPSMLPLVAWLVHCIADSPCVATLLNLVLRARVPPEEPLQDALSPLAAASLLRTLDVRVQPISNDGVGKQGRLQRHMSALLPLAKVRVGAYHCR